jgi:serine/threonine-protein kinase
MVVSVNREPPMSTPSDPDATGAYQPAPSASPVEERCAPGAVLAARYRVVAVLGRGGMGEVYRADDLTLGQPVALKFLPEHLARDPDRLARFRKEVAAARRVSHPNVCRVYDIADHGGQSFLTMEFVDGEDLSSVLKRLGRVPEEKGAEVAGSSARPWPRSTTRGCCTAT